MGLKAFRKCQFVQEGTPGSTPGGGATTLLVGTCAFNDEPVWFEPEEEHGKLSRYTRRTKIDELSRFSIDAPATYEQLIHFLAMAVKGGVSAEAGVEGYEWAYDPNLTSVNSPDTYYLEVGDDVQEWYANYVFCTMLELSFSTRDIWRIRADLVGRPLTTGTFTAGINPPTVEEILGSKTKLCIDSSWASIGGTEKTSTLLGGTIRFNTGLVPVTYGGSNVYFSAYAENPRFMQADLQVVLNAGMAAEYAYFIAGTRRFFDLQALGTVIDSELNRELIIRIAGAIQSWDKLGERDGEDVVNMSIVSEYDATASKEFWMRLKNGTATY